MECSRVNTNGGCSKCQEGGKYRDGTYIEKMDKRKLDTKTKKKGNSHANPKWRRVRKDSEEGCRGKILNRQQAWGGGFFDTTLIPFVSESSSPRFQKEPSPIFDRRYGTGHFDRICERRRQPHTHTLVSLSKTVAHSPQQSQTRKNRDKLSHRPTFNKGLDRRRRHNNNKMTFCLTWIHHQSARAVGTEGGREPEIGINKDIVLVTRFRKGDLPCWIRSCKTTFWTTKSKGHHFHRRRLTDGTLRQEADHGRDGCQQQEKLHDCRYRRFRKWSNRLG